MLVVLLYPLFDQKTLVLTNRQVLIIGLEAGMILSIITPNAMYLLNEGSYGQLIRSLMGNHVIASLLRQATWFTIKEIMSSIL